MPDLSIIVPVFNAEKYLSECIDSILAQTFNDFELILVDDGSADSSYEICKKYTLSDKRVKIIQEKNGGPGKARNTGLDAACGEWIGFCDSDDWIDPSTYQEALKTAAEKKSDLVQWELVMEYQDKSVPNICKADGFFTAAQSGLYYRSVVYASIYKRKIIEDNNIRFPTDSFLSEDALFNYQYYLAAENCFYLGKCFYHFRQNPASITHNVTKDKILGKKKVIQKISLLAEQNGGYGYVKNIKRNAKMQALFWMKEPDYRLFRELYPEISYKDLTENIDSVFARLWYFCIYRKLDFLADFMWRIKNILKKFKGGKRWV